MSEENKINEPNENETSNATDTTDGEQSEYKTSPDASFPDAPLFERDEDGDPYPRKKKRPVRISLPAFLISAVALILAAVMITYTCCNSAYKRKLAEVQSSQIVTGTDQPDARYGAFELFDAILEAYSFEELNEEEMMNAALKAYMYATGDAYAEYYTAEEYNALRASSAGDSEGIGVNVINTVVTINGVEWKSIRVINVMKGSPAEEAGLRSGDHIVAAGIGENAESVQELGYDVALTKLQGVAGTTATFTVYREGTGYLEYTIARGKVTASSVYYRIHAQDPTVGVVKIIQFDLTTPTQFSEAIDTLKTQGCTKFVFDVRYNPGGDLLSIEAVLSYFLNEGDVLIRTKDKSGTEEISTVAAVTYTGDYAGCSVTKSDIGKYRDLNAVVLCNGSTASAAELFTATFRDYELAPIVGTTTFGKGSMQTIMPLAYYGYSGALKLTTAKYFSAKDTVGYDGVGITPNLVVELSEEAAKQNVYEIPDGEDNQLAAALTLLQ